MLLKKSLYNLGFLSQGQCSFFDGQFIAILLYKLFERQKKACRHLNAKTKKKTKKTKERQNKK